MLTGVFKMCREKPSGQNAGAFLQLISYMLMSCGSQISAAASRGLGLTYLGHDNRGGHAPPLSAVGQNGGVAGGGEELAIAEAEEVEPVDYVI